MQTRMMNVFAAAALACSALVGCKGGGHAVVEVDGGLAEPVVILERVNGDSAALSFGTLHIETQGQYDALGDANIFPGEVDFDSHDLVIVSLGEQATGGYAVSIESIQLDGGELAVSGKASAPAADAVTTQALSYPYSAVLIENTAAAAVVPYID